MRSVRTIPVSEYAPVLALALPEQAHIRIPGIVLTLEHPAPIGDRRQHHPDRLAARAGSVTLRVHQQLVTLLRESLPGIPFLGDRGDPAPYQCDAVLLSLPRLFKTRLETIPADVPYLRAPAERRSAGRSGLPS